MDGWGLVSAYRLGGVVCWFTCWLVCVALGAGIGCGLFRLFGYWYNAFWGCMFAVVCDFCGGCVCRRCAVAPGLG